MKALKRFLIAAVVATAVLPASARVQPIDSFFVYGDSLVDIGNDFIATQAARLNPPIPPPKAYYSGRFTNGFNAVEYLWAQISGNAPGSPNGLKPYLGSWPIVGRGSAVSFGFGGSGTGVLEQLTGEFAVLGLQGQVALFAAALGGKAPPKRALYAIWSGANDYLRALVFGQQPLDPNEVVGNIARSIRFLYRLGARNIVVLDLPDLSTIPFVTGIPNEQVKEYFTRLFFQLSEQHNALLETTVNQLETALPDLELVLVKIADVQLPANLVPFPAALDVIGYPGASLCLFQNRAGCPSVNFVAPPLGYVFWDAEHPTTLVHQIIASHTYNALQSASLVP